MLPKCSSCTQAKRECGGYASNTIRAFINIDAANLSHPNKKRLLCEALANSKESYVSEHSTSQNDVLSSQLSSSFSRRVPRMHDPAASLQTDFSQHLRVLWRIFVSRYCKTEDYWPAGCSLLAFQNKALDFSLVALGAQHLALDSPQSSLSLLGLEAYNKSIGLYRGLLQVHYNTRFTALLAVTSTMYALMEISLMRPHVIANVGWGRSGHFDGALTMMLRSGPHPFSTDGFHLIFKKIREMGVSSIF